MTTEPAPADGARSQTPAGKWRGAWTALAGGAEFRVLAIGDSHVRVFEHWYFALRLPRTAIDIAYVPGATAIGIHNLNSRTGARRTFRDVLASRPADLVIVHLGEVDTAYTLWARAARSGRPVQALADAAVERYWNFLREIRRKHRVAVLSACLPTLPDQGALGDEVASVRRTVEASQRERTQLALSFNRSLQQRCAGVGMPFLDSSEAALGADGLVRPSWVKQGAHDHHYARLPFARWLAPKLAQLRHEAV